MAGVRASGLLAGNRRVMSLVAGLLMAGWSSIAALAQEVGCALKPARAGIVSEIIDNASLRLEDGAVIVLAGIKPPPDPGRTPSAFAEAARATLQRLVLRRRIEIALAAKSPDRHGRLIAQVFTVKGGDRVWVQRRMVQTGLARVATFTHTRACADALLAAERDARETGRGLWAEPDFAIRDAEPPGALFALAGSFQLVEGDVKKTAAVRSRVYLNFGEDYRRDFTISVERRQQELFRAKGVDLLALTGKRVRVRGWIELINGPSISATHPEQLEILDAK